MLFPKWKYRKHPTLGVFQSTLVANAIAEAELGPDWSDDPVDTGFQVRPATQIHAAHITDGPVLHEVVSVSRGRPLQASIDITTTGDIHG